MNRIFKVIWNHVRGSKIVCSENTRSCGKSPSVKFSPGLFALVVTSILIPGSGLISAAFAEGTIVIKNGEHFQATDFSQRFENTNPKIIAKGFDVSGKSSVTFDGDVTRILVDSKAPLQAYGMLVDGNSTIEFGARDTVIDVNGIGTSGTWGYGLDLKSGSSASFTGNTVSIKDYQRDYTAQTLTVREDSVANFVNKADVSIDATSPFSATAIVVKGNSNASLIVDNSGNLNVYSAIVDDATRQPSQKLGSANVIGLMLENGKTDITSRVNQANFTVIGQGQDYDGTSASDGTAAIFVQKVNANQADSRLTINSRELNVRVEAMVDPSVAPPGKKQYDDAYGIRAYAGIINVGAGTKTDIDVKESRGKAYGISLAKKQTASVADKMEANIAGDTTIRVTGRTGAYALNAQDGAVSR